MGGRTGAPHVSETDNFNEYYKVKDLFNNFLYNLCNLWYHLQDIPSLMLHNVHDCIAWPNNFEKTKKNIYIFLYKTHIYL